jgi:hypothetical protein
MYNMITGNNTVGVFESRTELANTMVTTLMSDKDMAMAVVKRLIMEDFSIEDNESGSITVSYKKD